MRWKLETSDVGNETLFRLDKECQRRRWPVSYVFIKKFTFYLSVCFQGANPSIIQVGEKRRSNGTERDDKASKKARSVAVKKETVKEEKPPLPVTPELIVIDESESEDDVLEYMSDSVPVSRVLKIYIYSY